MHPLGLVQKAHVWYLVAGTDAGLRTFRVGRVRSVETTDEPAERPEDFDLAETWKSIVEEVDERRTTFRALVRVDDEVARWIRAAFGRRSTSGERVEDGRIELEVRGGSAESLASDLAPFGARIEVVRPRDVRTELARLGRALVDLYGDP